MVSGRSYEVGNVCKTTPKPSGSPGSLQPHPQRSGTRSKLQSPSQGPWLCLTYPDHPSELHWARPRRHQAQ